MTFRHATLKSFDSLTVCRRVWPHKWVSYSVAWLVVSAALTAGALGANPPGDVDSTFDAGSVRSDTVRVQLALPTPGGLAAWWPGDGDARDIVSGFHGTMRSWAGFAGGLIGQAFKLGPAYGYVDVPISVAPGAFTFECWVNPSKGGTIMRVPGWWLAIGQDGSFWWSDIYGNFHSGPSVIRFNEWNHVAAARQGDFLTLYANGTQVAQSDWFRGEFGSKLIIGSTGVGDFTGLIDEVGIYTRRLAQTEIQELALAGAVGKTKDLPLSIIQHPAALTEPLGSDAVVSVLATGAPLSYLWQKDGINLADGGRFEGVTTAHLRIRDLTEADAGVYAVSISKGAATLTSNGAQLAVSHQGPILAPQGMAAWWPLDGNAQDFAGSRHGVLSVNPAFEPGLVGPAIRTGPSFSNIAVTSLGLTNGPFTFECWVRTTNGGTFMSVDGWSLAVTSAGAFFWGDMWGNFRSASGSIVLGKWSHVAAVRNGAELRLYVNGVEVAFADWFNHQFGNNLWIGGSRTPYFDGLIDEVGLYDRVLSVDELRRIVRAGPFGRLKNDAFSNSLPIVGASVQTTSANVGATRQPDEPNHGGLGGASVWWNWTAPFDGIARISTAGSSFDTLLGIYVNAVPAEAPRVSALNPIAVDDDGNGDITSRVEISIVAGQKYFIAVDGLGDGVNAAQGEIRLSVAADAPPVVALTAPSSGAVFGPGEPIEVCAQATDASGQVAKVEFFEGGRLLGTVLEGAGPTYCFTWTNAVPGAYSFAARATDNTGFSTLSDSVDISVRLPNDSFGDRISVSATLNTTVSVRGANLTATKEPGEPDHAGNPGGRSVWYTWRAAANIRVAVRTVGDGAFAPVVGVYRGGTVDQLELVATHVAADTGVGAQALFDAVAGVDYHIAVDGYRDPEGSIDAGLFTLVIANSRPPTVSFVLPKPNSAIVAGSNVPVNVAASDPDNAISRVTVFVNDTAVFDFTAKPYSNTWMNVSAGAQVLRAVATDAAGIMTTSAPVALRVLEPPQIVVAPESQNVRFGSHVLFSPTVVGSEPLTFQWTFNGSPRSETDSYLFFPRVTTDDAGLFRLTVTNEVGSVTTPVFALNVLSPGEELSRRSAPGAEGDASIAPAVSGDNLLIVGRADGKVYAYRPDSTRKWEFQTGDAIEAAPVIGPDGTVYIGSADGKFYAIAPEGTNKWTFATGAAILHSATLALDGSVYFISTDGFLYALTSNGQLKWRLEASADASVDSSPILDGKGNLFVTLADGRLLRFGVDGSTPFQFPESRRLRSAPSINAAGDTVYVGSETGVLYAINPFEGDGTEIWSFTTGGPISGTPAIGHDGTIYAGSDELYALRPDKSVKWRFKPGALIRSSPAIGADGTVYFGCDDNKLYAVTPDGTLRWAHTSAHEFERQSPVISPDGIVYFVEDDTGTLIGLVAESGPANSAWPMYRGNPKNNANAAGLPGDWLWESISDFSVYSAPVMDSVGRIWMAMDGTLKAFHADGTVAVPQVNGFYADRTPALSPTGILWLSAVVGWGPGRSELAAFDTRSLQVVSRHVFEGFVTDQAAVAIATDETVYFGVSLEDVSGRVYATNAITGFFRKWDFPHPVRVAPVVRSDGSVLVASGHVLSALSTNGAVEWTFNTGNPDDQPGTPLTGGPILDQLGNIYFVDLGGTFYALTPDGKERWPSRRLGYRADASPAIGENEILYALAAGDTPFGPALMVHALDLKREGAPVWAAPVRLPEHEIYSSPALGANGGIYFGGHGRFYAVVNEGASGRLAWSFDIEDYVSSPPLLTQDGVLYFGSGAAGIAGRFYALQASEPPANSFWPMFRRDPRRSGNVVGGNEPPKVTLTKPESGASFPAPASVSIEATASDPDGSVKQVEFFVDATSAGVDTTAPFTATTPLLDAGTYVLTARASDDRGLTTESAQVTIQVTNAPPLIVTHPQPQIVGLGAEAKFSVDVLGTPPFTYQWRFNGAPIEGASGATFTLGSAKLADAGNYSVVVNNRAGTATSTDALLTVVPLTELRTDFFVTDGPVRAITVANGFVYVGGSFSNVWAQTGGGAVVDLASGLPDALFPRIDGEVHTAVSDGKGGWYIGGTFMSVAGIERQRLAHLLANGLLDPKWAPAANRPVRALALLGSRVFVGGQFTNVNGVLRNRLAALDATSGQVISDWDPNADAPVHAIALADNTLYIGGEFLKLGATTRNRLAALDAATGAVQAWDPNADKPVFALAVSGETVFAGGSFNNVGRQFDRVRDRVAAIARDTAVATPWNPAPNAVVRALVARDGQVVVGGDFSSIGGRAQSYVAAFDPLSPAGGIRPWQPILNNAVTALAMAGDTLYAGGQFSEVGGQTRNRAAAFKATTGALLEWNPDADNTVLALTADGSALFMGGRFNASGQRQRLNAAAFDLTTGAVTLWNPSVNGDVHALLPGETNIFIGGKFTAAGGKASSNLASVDSIGGAAFNWPASVDATVFALADGRDFVYAAGLFTTANGVARAHLAGFSKATGQLRLWDPAANDTVFALAAAENRLFVGGDFTRIGGRDLNQIALFDLLGNGSASLWNPNARGDRVRALGVSGKTVFAGGAFTIIGGQLRERLAALDVETGGASSWDPQISRFGLSSVEALAVTPDRLIVGGLFDAVSGQSRTNVAAFKLSTAAAVANPPQLATEFAPNPDGAVRAVAAAGSYVFLGGDFLSIAGQPRSFFGVIGPDGPPVITLHPLSYSAAGGEIVSFRVAAIGQEPFTFQWFHNGTALMDAAAPVLTLPNVGSANAGLYQVRVQNRRGEVLSREASLAITGQPPRVITPGTNMTVLPGTTVTLAAEVTGNPPFKFQWRRNGENIDENPSALTSTLVLDDVEAEDSGTYTLVVQGRFGADIGPANVVVVSSSSSVSRVLADRFDDRIRTNSISGTVFGSSREAEIEIEDGEEVPLGKDGKRSVWFSWTAPASGAVTINTRGSGFDTLLGVFTGRTMGSLTWIAADDDSGGFGTSEVAFNATKDTEYQIVVVGYGASRGDVVLNWKLDTTVAAPEIVQGPFNQTVTEGENVAFTVQIRQQGLVNYQWFRNDVPLAGATDSFLVVRNVQRSDVGSYSVRVANEFGRSVTSSGATLQINYTETGAADNRVVSKDKLGDLLKLIAAEPLPGPGVSLHSRGQLHAPFGSAPARGFSGTQVFSTGNSRKQEGEPNHCGEVGGASEWFTIRAEANGQMLITTEGSDFDTVLAVYQGPENAIDFVELTAVDCDNDSGADGRTSRLMIAVVAGQVYHVAVDGVDRARGTVQFAYGLEPTIMEQPVSLTVNQGSPAVLRVVSTGKNFYQWLFNGVPLPGETNATLNIPIALPIHQGAYTVAVRNHAWQKTSQPAALAVLSTEPLRIDTASVFQDGQLRFRVIGGVGLPVIIQRSFDLDGWLPVHTNKLPGSGFDFIEIPPANQRVLFYRAVQ